MIPAIDIENSGKMRPEPGGFLLVACSVLEDEIALHRPPGGPVVDVVFHEMGLHDQPDVLRATLQSTIDTAAGRDDITAVALAYGLCGLGTAGLRANRYPLVIPRAHDCITLFLGGKEKYQALQQACPSCYFYTPGWNRGRRVPGPDKLAALRAEWLEKFDADDVEFLLESEREQWAMHDTATFIDLGTPGADAEADYARRCAGWLGWKFERLPGDAGLLRDLLRGHWDEERFQTIAPGETLVHRPDAAIMGSKAGDGA